MKLPDRSVVTSTRSREFQSQERLTYFGPFRCLPVFRSWSCSCASVRPGRKQLRKAGAEAWTCVLCRGPSLASPRVPEPVFGAKRRLGAEVALLEQTKPRPGFACGEHHAGRGLPLLRPMEVGEVGVNCGQGPRCVCVCVSHPGQRVFHHQFSTSRGMPHT